MVRMGGRGAAFGFGSVFAVDVHMATKSLCVGEPTLTKCALIRPFCAIIIQLLVLLVLIFVAPTVPAPLLAKIHADPTKQKQRLRGENLWGEGW